MIATLGCADLTAPAARSKSKAAPANEATRTAPAAAQRAEPPPQPAAPAPAAEDEGEMVRASHILVAYQGSARAKPEITRTKEQAKALAEKLAAQAKVDSDFAKLATEHSDDPTAKLRGGDLGKFTRDRMVKPFADAAFALKPGEISGVIETPFGYHVIKRTE